MTASERSALLEGRLIDFAIRITKVARSMEIDFISQHYAKQIVRSGSAPALLYAEARGAESDKDFKHKMSIALKELRETFVNLKIIDRADLLKASERKSLVELLDENNQLISIFTAAVKTVKAKLSGQQ